MSAEQSYECDIAIIGGGLGGVAAALAAAEAGTHVVLSEPTDWVGGQVTSQGVSALDEHQYIETFGGTRSYYRFRESIRHFYYKQHTITPGSCTAPLNPGNGWVSRLCFEPRVALDVLEAMLAPYVEAGRLTILLQHHPIAAHVEQDRIAEVVLADEHQQRVHVRATYVLDATETGDLLLLTGIPYVIGAEAIDDTGEPNASRKGPRPQEVQSFTYGFAVEYCPGESHIITKPAGYEHFRDTQPYTLVLQGHSQESRPFNMFVDGPTGLPPFWTYRRLYDSQQLDSHQKTNDLALINWASNDYDRASLIDQPESTQRRIHDEAKRLSLGFLYWLQTEAPRDDGHGYGYPELRLRPEVMGTLDGLSKYPYIRESRRIVPHKRIMEQDIIAHHGAGARATHFDDTIGVGWYAIDLHPCVDNPRTIYAPTRPFQIPLGALLPQHLTNLVAACKNIGTTHITNGSYRVHPVEWNIGESAGALAAFCCKTGHAPSTVWSLPTMLHQLQYQLLQRGIPLAWTTDVPLTHELFVSTQLLMTFGSLLPESPRYHSLALDPHQHISVGEVCQMVQASLRGVRGETNWSPSPHSDTSNDRAERADIEHIFAQAHIAYHPFSDTPNWGEVCEALWPFLQQTCTRR
ncbi:MAG: FAD-dependent oxidoreductase [Chloroflexi bacterium AL-W]|nr:FAD-dependent oxidoreductase [Chloroflexi bacterium AL-N1]NOK66067.1 FAD-dependent oxidoreductase [Chloroflexi bacterium AL-N10]NOK72948.1 FAD-dependent oxidoreductase [Chloroflexi bacterium AL-N5]NOK79845.1 FAD-dependent oxidoreductase [Chloroflexi bacterium AL-W]NOK88299.1 FAD-dependent oxidoreductase [Chloroflexi bacterium AL-N15]